MENGWNILRGSLWYRNSWLLRWRAALLFFGKYKRRGVFIIKRWRRFLSLFKRKRREDRVMATKELLEDSFPKLKHSSDRLFVFGLRVERKDDDLWSMKVKYYFDENGDIKFVPGFKYQVKK